MKIALVSLNQVWEDKEANFIQCKKYIQSASKEKVDLIIFPEMTLTGFTNNLELAENVNDSWSIKAFQNLSKKYNLAIVFGVIIKDKEKVKNCSIFLDKKGNILDIYTKIHPFSFANEDKCFIAGEKIVKVDFKDVKIGLSVCYDLRFCNLYSLMDDCEIVINIANWPAKRVEHWNALLKARAIENQTYIVGVNRTGIDGNNLEYIESSKIFNANGDELNFNKINNEVKIYEVNMEWNRNFKENFNTVIDKKDLNA